ncbi:family 76 glycosyl hydrolase [Diplocarpon rosae]|nr:family 76 glycosyl hydrolase [Diplocarpon rosae]
MRSPFAAIAVLLSVLASSLSAIELNIDDDASVKNVASTIAYGMVKYYTGNVTNTPETLGVLPGPYYWWQSGAMWGLLLDYYHYTGDSQYNNITTQALLSQVGPDYDYMVPMYAKSEGNDDQAFWGFATMSAAEKDYPQPTIGNYSWVQLTENLWNTQVRRWDMTQCHGGLKWQIFSFNNGYNYKNSVSNGAFFQLSARLARFTGNQTYADWAHKAYNWTSDLGLIDDGYHVFDGADDRTNCTKFDKIIWTYNNAIFMYGSAMMYNYTNGSALWADRTQGFLNASMNFFSPFKNSTNIMYEPPCETVNTCNTDQFSFKGYLSRFMWSTSLVAPFTVNSITMLLRASSQAAAASCSGGTDGVTCGMRWYVGGWDGKYGVGQQMSALETIQGLLSSKSVPPLHGGQVHLRASTSETPSAAPLPTKTETASPTISKKSAATSSLSQISKRLLLGVTGVLLGSMLMV